MTTTLVITPSSIISTYCHSIFRIEPASYCTFSCIYCYARWYRQENDKLTIRHIREFKKFIKYLIKNKIDKVPVFRLSTLVEPFQNDEKCLTRALNILDFCIEYEIPLIINTKSDNILKEDVMNRIIKLNDKGLVIVQISICSLNEELCKKLEPNAPSPQRRLNIIEKLIDNDVPTVVRYQPLIPTVADLEYVDIVEMLHNLHVRHIIVEALRLDFKTFQIIKNIISSDVKFVPYVEHTGIGILAPCREWRINVELKIRELCIRKSIEFAVCKEDTFYLTTSPDCCGVYLMKTDKAVRKVTILDIYRMCKGQDVPDTLDKLKIFVDTFQRDLRLMTFEYIEKLPKSIRKYLKWHHKLLIKHVTKLLTHIHDEEKRVMNTPQPER